jgi:hypothetical protein
MEKASGPNAAGVRPPIPRAAWAAAAVIVLIWVGLGYWWWRDEHRDRLPPTKRWCPDGLKQLPNGAEELEAEIYDHGQCFTTSEKCERCVGLDPLACANSGRWRPCSERELP